MDVAPPVKPWRREAVPGRLLAGALVLGALGLAALSFVALKQTSDGAAVGRPAVVAVGEALRRLASQQAAGRQQASLAVAPPTPAITPPASRTRPGALFLTARWACDFMATRAQHAGEVVTFRGEYMNDHIGPAWIRPLGCDHGVAVTALAAQARFRIDRADPRPWTFPRRRLVGVFTAKLVRGGGVWLDVERVERLQDVGRPPRNVR